MRGALRAEDLRADDERADDLRGAGFLVGLAARLGARRVDELTERARELDATRRFVVPPERGEDRREVGTVHKR